MSLGDIVRKAYSTARSVVAAGLIAGLSYLPAGCRATHYPMPEQWQHTHEKKIRHDFKGRLDDFVNKEFNGVLGADATKAKVTEVTSDYKEPDGLRDKAKNALDAQEYDALTEILKQNQTFSALNAGLGMHRYVIEITDKNIEYKGLRVAPLSEGELRNASYALFVDLAGSLRATKHEDRKKLLDALAGEKCDAIRTELSDALRFNADNLELYRKLVLSAGCVAYVEGNLPDVFGHLNLASEMSKEVTGHDAYADGQKALAKLKGMKVGDFVDLQSPLGQRHKQDMLAEAVYQKELEEIAKEAKGWGWDTRDNIVQAPAYFLLNLAMQAYHAGKLDDQEFDDVQRVMLRDMVTKIGESIPKDPGLNVGAILLSVAPGSSLYKLIASISPAFTPNYFSPEDKDRLQAFTRTVREGHARVFGFNNAENYQDSNTPAVTTLIISSISTAGQAVTGIYFIYSGIKGKGDDSVVPSTSPPLGGSGTGGSGTNNRRDMNRPWLQDSESWRQKYNSGSKWQKHHRMDPRNNNSHGSAYHRKTG